MLHTPFIDTTQRIDGWKHAAVRRTSDERFPPQKNCDDKLKL